MTTASQMWPIWNLLPTQPVQTGPVAAAWALRLSLLTFLRDNTALHLPPSLFFSPPCLTLSGPTPPWLPSSPALCLWPRILFLTDPPLTESQSQFVPPGPLSVSPCLCICPCPSPRFSVISLHGRGHSPGATAGVTWGKFSAQISWVSGPIQLPAPSTPYLLGSVSSQPLPCFPKGGGHSLFFSTRAEEHELTCRGSSGGVGGS